MPYVKNPTGRIVDVEQEYFKDWLAAPGFTEPTKQEISEWNEKRHAEIESWKKQAIEPAIPKTQDGVYFVTVSQGGKDGYGIASKNIHKYLQEMGLNVSFSNDNQKIALLLHAPYSISRLESPVRILYTMFESTKIPDDWVFYLDQADVVIVPSTFNQKVFQNAGVESTVVPLGYDDTVYQFMPREIKADKHENFTFLHYNAFNIRKGFTEVFKAFVQEFSPDEPVRMLFKTTLPRMPIPILKDQYPNIEVITGETSETEMKQIMARSDAFVFPSRGEGFGMTPLEAMATGLPTIVPNAHGISEYFNYDYMYECKIEGMCTAIYSRYKGRTEEETKAMVGEMYVTDVASLRAQMRWIYEHQKEAMEKGKAASEYVKKFTYKQTALKLKAIIDDYSNRPESKKPLKNVLRLEQLGG